MDSKGQFVTIVFAVLLITVIIAIFSLEYSNLVSNQNLNLQQSDLISSNSLAYNLVYQYSFMQSLGPSSQADSFILSSLPAIEKEVAGSYSINFSSGVTVSDSSGSISSVPALVIDLANQQSSATASPFQQMIIVNSSEYSGYEATNLQNIQFSYSNGTIIPSWLESGNLADFNGYTSRIVLPQTVNYSIGKATITGWVEVSGFTSSNGVQEWWTNGAGSPAIGLQSYPNTYPNPTSTSFTFFVHNSTGEGSGCGSASIPLNTVYFVAEVIDLNNATMYVDGKLSCTFTFNGAEVGNVSLPVIGSYSSGSAGAGDVMDGVIANVQAYNTPLTSSQVASLYREGEDGSPITTAKGWWPLDGNANDYSGHGYNGVIDNVSFSGPGSASTDTTYWLRVGSIAAKSKLAVDMNFYPTQQKMFNNINTGEAPQFSQIYGEYFDAKNVFTDAWLFNQSSLPTGWSGSDYATNSSGLWIFPNGGLSYSIASTNQGTFILDEADWLNSTSPTGGAQSMYKGFYGSGAFVSGQLTWSTRDQAQAEYIGAGNTTTLAYTYDPYVLRNTMEVVSISDVGDKTYLTVNNAGLDTISVSNMPSVTSIQFNAQSDTSTNCQILYALYSSSTPTNDIMPIVLFEGIQ